MQRATAWALALASLALLLALAELSLQEAARQPTLGIATASAGGSVVVTYVLPAGTAWDAGIRPGDRILEADGRPAEALSAPDLDSARSLVLAKRSGAEAATPLPENIPVTSSQAAAFLFLAAAFALLGGITAVIVDRRRLGLLFLAWTVSAAACFELPIAQVSGRPWPYVLENLALIAFGGSTLALFLAFPANRLARRPARLALWAAGVWHLAIALAYGYSVLGDSLAYEVVQKALHLTLAADLVVAVVAVAAPLAGAAIARRGLPAASVLVLIGVAGGLFPFAAFSLVPHSLGAGYLVSPDTAILSLILLPLSLAATMGQLIGVRSWLRRGLIRLFVWTLLLMGYGLALTILLGEASGGSTALRFAASPFIVVVVIGVTLPLLERKLRFALESALLRDVYSFPAALERFSAQVVNLKTPQDIALYALSSLGGTLDLSWAALTLRLPEPTAFQWGACPAIEPDRPPAGAADVVQLGAEDNLLGVLAVGPKKRDIELQPEDRSLLRTVAPLLAIAFQLVRQLDIVAERERQLEQLSERLFDVQEDVRRGLALELHDDAMQRAILLAREIEERSGELLDSGRWSDSLQEIVIGLRAVCVGLYPTVLDDLGLPAALEQLAGELRARTEIMAEVCVRTDGLPDFGRLDRELELALYRIAQESMNNVRKHAAAESVLVSLERRGPEIELRVLDDGASDPRFNAMDPRLFSGLGVIGMRQRLARWGGALSIAGRETGGTEVRATVRLVAAAA
jgi:signal transduction histidine kinase